MTLILDAGPAVALVDRRDPLQSTVDLALRAEDGEIVVPGPVLGEIDYLLSRRLGRNARRLFLADVADRRFRVVCLEPMEYQALLDYDQRHADFVVGVADLSVVLLAWRFGTKRVMTFDERHFRALRPIDGGSFVLLPMDA